MTTYDISNLPPFLNQLGWWDLQSLILCLQAYNDEPRLRNRINIDDVGFNKFSGNAYLVLDNGTVIASSFGQPCVFILHDSRGEEIEFDSYDELLAHNADEAI